MTSNRLIILLPLLCLNPSIANPTRALHLQETPSPPSFATYLWRAIFDASPARQEEPFTMPNCDALDTPEDLANRLFSTLKEQNACDQFLFGASTSEHQCSKLCTPEICSYSAFAQQRNLPQPIDNEYPMDLWKFYKQYIDYARDELHLNSLRFSVEWPLVQPINYDSWNQEALDHYADMFTYAIKKGITPLINFHHYTDPVWFLEKGGFEKGKNIVHFKNFCVKIYEVLLEKLAQDKDAQAALQAMQPREPLFATFNSPEGYAFKGYREMMSPPANPEKKGLTWAVKVLKNMMRAHVEVYYGLKEVYQNNKDHLPQVIKEPKIGLLKNIHQLDPACKTTKQWCLSPLSKFICIVADMLQNEGIFQFFTNGTFKTHIPFTLDEAYHNERAIGALDWVGLNYYSNRYMCLTETIEEDNEALKTDNARYRIHPHGLYRAIVELSERLAKPLGIPLYVTENGIATMDDNKRYTFYQQYLYALVRANEDGYPVLGYLPWTFFDNYEWPSTTNPSVRKYGLCTVNPDDPSQLQYKEGSRSYLNFIEHFIKTNPQLINQN